MRMWSLYWIRVLRTKNARLSIIFSPVCEVRAVLWVLRQAEVVSSTPFDTVISPSSDARVEHLSAWCLRAGALPPPGVDGPPTPGARGSSRSRGADRSLFPIPPWGSISPGETVPPSQQLHKHTAAIVLGHLQTGGALSGYKEEQMRNVPSYAIYYYL